MKLMKKWVVILCALIPMLIVHASAAKSYNADAALSYAAAHWNDGKGLCAEFVSDCLKAGGLSSWSRGASNLYESLYDEAVNGGIAKAYTLETDGRNYIRASSNKGKIDKGDILFWYCSRCVDYDGAPYCHVAIVGGTDKDGDITVYQHNSAKNNTAAYVGQCYIHHVRYSEMRVIHFEKTEYSISFPEASVTMKPQREKEITISFTGDDISKLGFGIDNSEICSCRWNGADFGNRTANLVIKGEKPGKTTVTVYIHGEGGKEVYKKEITVIVEPYDVGLSLSQGSLKLDLKDKKSQTITLTINGSTTNGMKLNREISDDSVVSLTYGEGFVGRNLEITVTALKQGTATIKHKVQLDGETLATVDLNVTVTAPTYSVRYDANGGGGAPATQTKNYQQPLVLSDKIPEREGYKFAGWSKDFKATEADYLAGGTYTADSAVILYAVWKEIVPEAAIITVGNGSAPAGRTLTVPVAIKDNPGVAGFGLQAEYDKSAFELKEIERIGVISTGNFVPNTENGIVLWWNTKNVSENGEILNLVFEIRDNTPAGSYPLGMSLVENDPSNFVDEDSESVKVVFEAGEIIVEDFVYGDLTGDGEVTAGDAVKLARALVNLIELTEREMRIADVTGDGKVSAADAVKLARFLIKIIDSLNPTNDPMSVLLTAYRDDRALIRVESSLVEKDGKVILPVRIEHNPGFAGFNFDLNYNSSEMELIKVDAGPLLKNGELYSNLDTGTLFWASALEVEENGVLCYLHFNTKASTDWNESKVSVVLAGGADTNLSDENCQAVEAEFIAGYAKRSPGIELEAEIIGGNLKITLTGNEEIENGRATAFIAYYLDNRMVNCSVRNIEEGVTIETLSLNSAYDLIKIIVVDSITRLTPLCVEATIKS